MGTSAAVLPLAVLQAARDGLAALHGDPKRAALGEEKFDLAKQEASNNIQAPKKESWQKSVLDSLVSCLNASSLQKRKSKCCIPFAW